MFPVVSLLQYEGLNCMRYDGSGCALLGFYAVHGTSPS